MADVSIDSVVTNSTGRGMRAVRFTTASIGYCFYIDEPGDNLVYAKTTDGGASWGASVAIETGTTLAYDIWFDQDTPGDSGTLIHIAWFTSASDDVEYRTLDTSSDTLGTSRIVFAGSTFVLGRGVFCSVTKTRSGYIYIAYDGDAGAEKGLFRSTDGGVNWSANLATTFVEATLDQCLLFPASNTGDNNDCWAVYHDADADALTLKMWDSSAGSATESATIEALIENTTDLTGQYGFSASVRHSDGHLIIAAVTERDTGTSDHRVFDVNGTGSITELTAITTNIDDHYYPAVFIDQNTDDIYVAFNGLRAGTEVLGTTTKVYYTKSTDDGTTWSAGSTAYMEGATAAVFQVWAPLMGPRFYVMWRVGTTLVANAINSISFEGITGTGALTVSQPALAGSGLETFTATGALSVPQPALAGTGVNLSTIEGSGALSVSQPALAASGLETFTATGALSVPAPAVAASGALTFSGSSELSVSAPAFAGTGFIEVEVTGAGALSVPQPAVAGTGALTFTGSSALSVGQPALAGSGVVNVTVEGTGELTVPAPAVAGTGAVIPFVGTASLSAAATLTGSGLQTFVGTGVLTVTAPALVGMQVGISAGVIVMNLSTPRYGVTNQSTIRFGVGTIPGAPAVVTAWTWDTDDVRFDTELATFDGLER